jgi:hypothetical protein
MTKQVPDQNAADARERSLTGADSVALNYQNAYLCPVCRHGQITGLTLMDAFACNFCRHIFTANLVHQSVQVVDSSQPMSWQWNGRKWQAAQRNQLDLTLVVWFVSAALVVLPSSLVWLSAHIFPPLPDSAWSWFPIAWVGCTFSVHFLMMSWLIAEHYQLPFYVSTRIRLRQRLGHR